MKEIKTGIYKRIWIRLPKKELIIPVKNLESKIKNLNFTIEERSQDKQNNKGQKENLERLKRMVKTAEMLVKGYQIEGIAKKLKLKYSTVESYISYLDR